MVGWDKSMVRHLILVLLQLTTAFAAWQDEACNPHPTTCPFSTPPLLLISLDGFRAKYLLEQVTPNIKRLMDCGTHAPFMYSSFPSITFPNHYAIVTGLYPESHGIVDNEMYDPAFNATFSISSSSSLQPRWWGGEPIWNTIQKQGKIAGSYFWPGSEVLIGPNGGMRPNYYYKYDGNVPFENRTEKIIEWLHLNDSLRPDFITLYYDEPDHLAHEDGPDSPEVTAELIVVDNYIDLLMTRLYDEGFFQCMNIILLADHGFTSSPCENVVVLNTTINVKGLKTFNGPVGRLHWTKSSTYASAADIEASLVCKSDLYTTYGRPEMPRRLHYSRNARCGDVILPAHLNWVIMSTPPTYCLKGEHGYDFRIPDMHTIFIAHGPMFKANYTIDAFQNVELYNLMLRLLGLPEDVGAPNNGTVGSMYHVLREAPAVPTDVSYSFGQCPMMMRAAEQCGTCLKPPSGIQVCINNYLNIPSPHLRLGMDSFMPCDATTCRFITAYSQELNLPLAVTFVLPPSYTGFSKTEQKASCVVRDRRSHAPCDFFVKDSSDIKMQSLYLGESNHFEAYYASNFVPMHNGFFNGVWQYFRDTLVSYVRKFGALQVSLGPVFDNDYDGLADNASYVMSSDMFSNTFPVPTHYFAVVSRCDGDWLLSDGSCMGNVSALAFALPHRPQPVNTCQNISEYLYEHTARIKDVEWLTGLQFFTSLAPEQSVLLRTQIHQDLWLINYP